MIFFTKDELTLIHKTFVCDIDDPLIIWGQESNDTAQNIVTKIQTRLGEEQW